VALKLTAEGALTTTASRKAIDRIRRENKRHDKQKEAQMLDDVDPPEPAGAIEDDRLRLIFGFGQRRTGHPRRAGPRDLGHGTVTDGPYPETKEVIGGFAVVDVPSREEALEWAAQIAVACRCAQEVRELLPDPTA
jgi:hypothetical protein